MNNRLKTVMFATLIFSMAAGSGIMASAQTQDDSQRVAQKMINISQNFASYLETQQSVFDTELQIYNLDQRIITIQELDDVSDISSLVAQKAALQNTLNTLLQKIDTLQQQSYTLHEVPSTKMQKLEQVKNEAIQQYNTTSYQLDTVFIDAAEESVQVILFASSNATTSSIPTGPRGSSDSSQSLAERYGIAVEIKKFTPSSTTYETDSIQDCTGTTKNNACGPLAGGVEICVRLSDDQCVRGSLGFPATRSSVSGFVTAAHLFAISGENFNGTASDVLNDKVFQVGPAIKTSDDTKRESSTFDTSYGTSLIGILVHAEYNTDDDYSERDSAFVQLQSGARTLPQEIVSSGTTKYTISSYSESDSDKSIGTYVTKSGMKSGVTAGMIRFSDEIHVYATYNECDGDSGAPVGILSGASFKVTGMHVGKADNVNYTIQSCGENHDGYSKFMQYTVIKSDLDLS